ncbi:16S rRNA (guanine(527)-N(7))-methyltransferase RsmG [Legionella londiniensis]|uniref:Ribosomal RNA small subunit methyltransferase G n=1 Tax=Legionella londiniensis TaxID=45068 RepID=A0A0W0VHA8_9GAMM|nr:16S rRNA (guanine(527)-N(7))-methyltransferase RsmG [Legionella londiniensis]KTD19544.1 glucose inhibited division protein B GidB [Legionella londiniensis]STX92235.1 glucose inhibited division protein B GidB [Legionella londiniensis]
MNSDARIKTILAKGLQELGLAMPLDALLTYLDLLYKWNQTYNLTAIRDSEAMASRHILDSLAIAPWVQGMRILDVGTGAGLPGIPLAIAFPEKHIVLLDSNGKKIRFLKEVKRLLRLDNVSIVNSRVETYHPALGFDTVVSRAFSDLQQMIRWTQHLLAPHGIWLAMKGRLPEGELKMLDVSYEVKHYKVPSVEGERCCVIIFNQSGRQ